MESLQGRSLATPLVKFAPRNRSRGRYSNRTSMPTGPETWFWRRNQVPVSPGSWTSCGRTKPRCSARRANSPKNGDLKFSRVRRRESPYRLQKTETIRCLLWIFRPGLDESTHGDVVGPIASERKTTYAVSANVPEDRAAHRKLPQRLDPRRRSVRHKSYAAREGFGIYSRQMAWW